MLYRLAVTTENVERQKMNDYTFMLILLIAWFVSSYALVAIGKLVFDTVKERLRKKAQSKRISKA